MVGCGMKTLLHPCITWIFGIIGVHCIRNYIKFYQFYRSLSEQSVLFRFNLVSNRDRFKNYLCVNGNIHEISESNIIFLKAPNNNRPFNGFKNIDRCQIAPNHWSIKSQIIEKL